MIGQLTAGERQLSVVILVALAIIGIAMAAAGRFDPLGIHGVVILLCSGVLLARLLSSLFEPEPHPERLSK